MQLSSFSEPALPAAWTDMLGQIQRALAQSLKTLEERAGDPESPETSEAVEAAAVWQHIDNRLQSCAADMTARLDQIDQDAAALQPALASAQEALERWLQTSGQVGQRVAELASRAV